MIKNKYLIILFQILLLIFLTTIIYKFNLDLRLQEKFYKAGSEQVWYQKNSTIWHYSYQYGTIPAILVSFFSLVGLLLSFIKPKIAQYRKYLLLLLLTILIGPGLIVNATFKDHWGRPRPRQVKEFGGQWEFKQVWEQGVPGKGKSFPCGHCSMGFYFIALYYALKRKKRKLAYLSIGLSLFLGIIIGFARIAQGGHFLSDVLWAWGFTSLTASILYYFILKIPDYETKQESKQISTSEQKKNPLKTILVTSGIVISIGLIIFLLIFSKPVYKEFKHNIVFDKPYNIININLIDKLGDLEINSGEFAKPIRIETTIHGFGFPVKKFKCKVTKNPVADTLYCDYFLKIDGFFNEMDVNTKVYINSSVDVNFSGKIIEGNITIKNDLLNNKISTHNILINKGK